MTTYENPSPELPDKLILKLLRAPGDTVALTALIRDLKAVWTSRQIAVNATACDQLLAYNPHITPIKSVNGTWEEIEVDYRRGLEACKLGAEITMLEDFHRDIYRKYRLTVPLTDPRPELHLNDEEQATRPFDFPYWVVVAGYKTDMQTKMWSAVRFQEVVNQTQHLNWVQVGAPSSDSRMSHIHYPLAGAIDLLGKTSLRELMTLIYHAEGVLCGPTMAMLMAAAFWKPCVVVAGGRENWQWLSFTRDNPAWGSLASKIKVPHRFLHTIGQLECCQTRGCFTRQVFPPHNDSPFPAGFLCRQPGRDVDNTPLPACMSLIATDQVVQAVLSYSR